MKTIIGYFAVVCISLIGVASVVKTPSSPAASAKSSIQANIEARKAILDEI